jgi:hypothetical protein
MNIEQMFADARARIHAAIDLRIALALRQTAKAGEHHRRALAQRLGKSSTPPTKE